MHTIIQVLSTASTVCRKPNATVSLVVSECILMKGAVVRNLYVIKVNKVTIAM